MPLLKCDFSAAMEIDRGFSANDLAGMSERVDRIRESMVTQLPSFDDTGRLLSAPSSLTEPSEWRFISLPEELLAAYTTDREDSPMGHVFRIANSLHDEIDAVAVVGTPASLRTCKAIMHACCMAHHNETDRAERGSKPRLYFLDAVPDNDAIAARLDRLQWGGFGDTKAERRFAVVTIHDQQPNPMVDRTRKLAIEHLKQSLGTESSDWLARLVIDVAATSSHSTGDASGEWASEFVPAPPDLPATHCMLSPATLLPAAFLGLDCMRMLSGAMQMSNHFKEADFESNLVMQLASANFLLDPKPLEPYVRITTIWCDAVRGIADWYSGLVCQTDRPTFPVAIFPPADNESPFLSNSSLPIRGTCQDVWVETVRDDLIHATSDAPGRRNLDAAASPVPHVAENSLPDMMRQVRQSYIARRRETGCPTIQLTLRELDTHSIGQLVQLWMIADAVESRLANDTER